MVPAEGRKEVAVARGAAGAMGVTVVTGVFAVTGDRCHRRDRP
ncbi:hypothetical protein AB0M28_11355 [Streptomyces sp. NPDC051940]